MWWVRGGWVDKRVWHRPITVRCIGFGAVLQIWLYWWCSVARMVGFEGVAEPASHPPMGCARICHQKEVHRI